MTEVMGFPPRWGFGPHSTTVTGGLHAQRSARGDCSVSSDILSPGFTRRGAGLWRGTFAAARRRGDRPAHTVLRTRSVLMCSKIEERFSNALIQRDLPARHRHKTWRERRGVIRSAVRGRPTAAPAPAPFWLRCSTSRYATDQVNTNESQTVAREAPHHQVRGRRTVRAHQSREGTPGADVARRAGRVVGNQFSRRLRDAESRVGFLPAVNGRVSASVEP